MSISKEAVLEKMGQDHVVILNVLQEAEFEKLHIRGSLNLPWTKDEAAFTREVATRYGMDNFFILYGSGIMGHEAIDAVEALQRRGFEAEAYLSGMKEWNGAGAPMEGTGVRKRKVAL